ncbi:MAG: response regulator [Burkholderiales bacterium]|nr:response regulator [Burkholderiales bacterium]
MNHPSTATYPVEHEAPRQLSVERQILALLARQVTQVPWPVGAAALVVCIMGWQRAPHWALLSWLASIWLTQALRWQVLRGLPTSDRPLPQSMRTAIFLSGLNGLCHACSVGFFPYFTEGQRAVLTLVLAGITMGAVGTTSGHTRIFHAFALPTMLSVAAGWALTPLNEQSRWIGLSMAIFLLAYLGILTSLAKGTYRSLQRSIIMQIKQWRLNEELRQALAQAEDANAAKTRFLASASHDLRQPLHTLTLFCAALMTHRLEPATQGIVSHMDSALQVLRTQLTALLDISKLDAGIVTVHPKAIDIIGFVQRLHEEFTAEAGQKKLVLVLDTDHKQIGDLFVETDPLHLERIVRNLIDNAIKYCDAGTIWIRARATEGGVDLTVQDTGRGIATHEMDKIYEEFYQIDNPERDRSRGLGLGLAIVKRLTQLINTPMTLTSELGVGTTITLNLKRVQAPVEQPVLHDDSGFAMPVCHMLVLDDETAILEAMKTLLESQGCRVTLAHTTDEAAQKAAVDQPDVVLADFRLRGQESGIKAIRKLRQQYPDLPALLISGDTAEDRLKEAHDAGLRLLHKPVSVDVLLEAIAQSLDSEGHT